MLVVGAMVGQHSQLIAKFLIEKSVLLKSLLLTMQNCVPSVQVVQSREPGSGSSDGALQVIPAES